MKLGISRAKVPAALRHRCKTEFRVRCKHNRKELAYWKSAGREWADAGASAAVSAVELNRNADQISVLCDVIRMPSTVLMRFLRELGVAAAQKKRRTGKKWLSIYVLPET